MSLLRAISICILTGTAIMVSALGQESVTWGKGWAEWGNGRYGYIQYWAGLTYNSPYITKFVYRHAYSVGGAATATFESWQLDDYFSSAPADAIQLLMTGTWNGMPAKAFFRLTNNAKDGRDHLRIRIYNWAGNVVHFHDGYVVQGDFHISWVPRNRS